MKFTTLFLAIFLGWTLNVSAASYTEFFADPSSACTNINAGSTSTGAPAYTTIATTAAGGWNSGGTFTPTDGTTPASSVAVGDWVSIYTNSVNTNAVFIARVTSVAAGANGAIGVSTVAKMGTAPTTVLGSVANISLRAGGTWAGPHTFGALTVGFPFNLVGPNATNLAGSMVCVNFRGGTNYNITNAVTHSVNGPMRFEGYTNSAHDGGLATFKGLTSGINSYIMLTVSAGRNDFINLKFQDNGSSTGATSAGVSVTGSGNLFRGCVFQGMRGSGFTTTGLGHVAECEASTNNLNNTAALGGFQNAVASQIYERCIAHDNTNANACGFISTQPFTLLKCISFRNGIGISTTTTGDPVILINTDAYWNTAAGFDMSGAAPAVSQLVWIENCNFITNGTFGINSSTASTFWKRNGEFFNNGFGSGNRTNSSGNVGLGLTNVYQSGFVTYASGVTPWVAPDSGNFRINLAAAYGTGRGAFVQTAAGLTNSLVGFPVIGAVQPAGFTNSTGSAFAQ